MLFKKKYFHESAKTTFLHSVRNKTPTGNLNFCLFLSILFQKTRIYIFSIVGVCWHRAIPILFFYLAAYFRNKIGGFLSPKSGPRPKDFVSGWLAWVTPCIFVSRFGQSVSESCSEIVIVQIWTEAQHWNRCFGSVLSFLGLQFGHPQSEFCILKQYSTKSFQACLRQLTLQEEQLRFIFIH